MRVVRFEADFESWRRHARRLLTHGTPPESVHWEPSDVPQGVLQSSSPESGSGPPTIAPRVSARFLHVARLVACHRNPTRWTLLYRALWRQTGDEPHLLALATDPDVAALYGMARAVKRAAHKMKAFVRFRSVESELAGGMVYVAWFEPAHLVVEATAPFFARRFRSMRWSILTPDRCAHWDGATLRFSPGASRAAAPTDDALEELWRTYYANAFNPARLNPSAMRSEMPQRYWRNLPESRLIAGLSRDAPRRLANMLSQTLQPPEPLPADLAATEPPPATPAGRDPTHDPGVRAARARLQSVAANAPTGMRTPGGTTLYVGVAGWTDATLTAGGVFYPRGVENAEDRLRYYAARYPIVEVDATYYSMPTRAMAVEWARRTPDGFVFDVKAHGLMTGHGADVRRLPDWLRRELPRTTGERLYGRDLPAELLDEVWRRFLGALEPLREAGKLGAILLQFPRWFTPSRESAAALAACRTRLGQCVGAVELRHHSWMTGRLAERTPALLSDLDLAYVVVDGPQGMESSMPPALAVTSPRLAVMRLHGRRTETWEARNHPATERYRYLYDEEELAEHLRRILELSHDKANALHIIYNNCHGNYAVTNAAELTWLLLEGRADREVELQAAT